MIEAETIDGNAEKFVSPCSLPTPYEREILICLMEECAEVQQRAAKLLRFGRDEIQSGQPHSNSKRLEVEISDLLVVINVVCGAGLIGDEDRLEQMAKKRAKLNMYMQFIEE